MADVEAPVRQAAPPSSLLRAAPQTHSALRRAHDPLVHAQRAIGNQALQRLLGGGVVQAQMVVGPVDDEHEREAEEMAGVVQRAVASPAATPAPAPEPRKEEDEKKVVKRAPLPGSAPSVSPTVEHGIESARGGGQPLAAADRSRFEPHFDRDLSDVRLHTDSRAAALARDLQANAFTTGSDIFFGEGRYQPGTSAGDHLLAHELTHTVQQASRRVSRRVQRSNGGGGAANTVGSASVGLLDRSVTPNVLTLPSVDVPAFKLGHYGKGLYATGHQYPMQRHAGYTPDSRPDQRADWRRELAATDAARVTELQRIYDNGKPPNAPAFNQSTAYAWRMPHRATPITYRPDAAAREWRIPTWNRAGRGLDFEVDHLRELQLANWSNATKNLATVAWANTRDNWALLDQPKNSSSGASLRGYIADATRNFIASNNANAQAVRAAIPGLKANPPASEHSKEAAKLRRTVHVRFTAAHATGLTVTANDYWTIEECESGLPLRQVRLASSARTSPDANKIQLFGHPDGGKSALLDPGNVTPAASSAAAEIVAPLRITALSLSIPATPAPDAAMGTATVRPPTGGKFKSKPAQNIPVKQLGAAERVGYLDSAQLQAYAMSLQVELLSPLTVDEFGIGENGLIMRGRVLPEIEPIRRANIQFSVDGDDLTIFKEFAGPEIDLPPPLRIDDISLIVFASTQRGLGIEGGLDFSIDRVGQGRLSASVSTGAGVVLEGRFFFDTQLFTRAEIGVRWNGHWSGDGVLEIGEGKVPGIRRATATVAYEPGHLHAEGTADLSVPGIQQGSLTLDYSEAEGIAIGGSFALANNIPGIRGGSARALVRQRPDGTYSVTAHGEAQPAIPGVDAAITVDYADGAITIEGRGAYSRGRLAGSVMLGATNRSIDPATGQPTGPPGNALVAYGRGSATVQLTPWLQGTIALQLLPNGEIVVTGEIGLPAALELFPAKTYERNIFSIGIDIPILGIAFAGQRIGIFATVRGGLDLSASVGPGELRRLGLRVTYNPDHEDQTRIEGGAQLYVPAQAGLRMFVRGGIGAGIPIVSATANLELGGRLGLEGALEAGVNVDWLASRGLVLDASAGIHVEPKLRFDVTASVLVEADLLLTTITLYEHRWELAAVEYGSGLRFGLTLPIHYEEGRPFDLNWSDVQFEIPNIDASDVLRGLVGQIVG